VNRTIFLLLSMIMGLTCPAWSQSDSVNGQRSWELSGSVFFSSNTQTHGQIEYTTNTWAVQPAVAYLWGKHIELSFDIQYQGERDYADWPDSRVAVTNSTLRAAIGLGANLPIASGVWVFGIAKVGISWNYGSYSDLVGSASHWSAPSVVFPIIQGGAKLFVNQGCAVIVAFQYDHVSSSQSIVTLGVGFAAYL
jgi:hypothetical protein